MDESFIENLEKNIEAIDIEQIESLRIELANNLNHITDIQNGITEKLVNYLDNLLKELADSADEINEKIEYHWMEDPSLERDWKTIDLLYGAGFWNIPSLPRPVFESLLELDDKSKENVSSLILELMNKDNCHRLESMIKKWDLNVFKEKKLIFQEALNAHKEGKYILSIPTSALQAEPIIKDFLSINPQKMMGSVKDEFKDRMKNVKEKNKEGIFSDENFIDENKSRALFLSLVALRFIEEVVIPFYTRHPFDNVTKTFNRNVIGHGALKVEDYDQELSTKLFLFLDTLHFFLNHFQDDI